MEYIDVWHYHTAFTSLDAYDTEDFMEIAFSSLRREALKVVKAPGAYKVKLTIEALKDN